MTYNIVGYRYNADVYCPSCIVAQLPTGPGQRFDGWALAPGVRMSVEDNLNEIAAAFGIDRMREDTFDGGDFPKLVTSLMLQPCGECDSGGLMREGLITPCTACDRTGIGDRCGACGEVLGA